MISDPSFRMSEVTGVIGEALTALYERSLLQVNPDREVKVFIQDIIDKLKALEAGKRRRRYRRAAQTFSREAQSDRYLGTQRTVCRTFSVVL